MYTLKRGLDVVRLALRSSADYGSALTLVCASAAFPLGRAVGWRAGPFRVRLREAGTDFSVLVTDGSDIGVLIEVFLYKEYELLTDTASVVLDLGANVGYSALYLAAHCPSAEIYSFEPLPETYAKLKRNTISNGRIVPVQSAVGTSNGMIDFFDYEKSSMSSSLVRRYEHQPLVLVPVTTLDSFIAAKHITAIDVLKFDIEGSEYDVFASFTGIGIVKAFIGEFHEDLSGHPLVDFTDLFKAFDLSVKQVSLKRYIVQGQRRLA
jgi:FkbM family methyltransferase